METIFIFRLIGNLHFTINVLYARWINFCLLLIFSKSSQDSVVSLGKKEMETFFYFVTQTKNIHEPLFLFSLTWIN